MSPRWTVFRHKKQKVGIVGSLRNEFLKKASVISHFFGAGQDGNEINEEFANAVTKIMTKEISPDSVSFENNRERDLVDSEATFSLGCSDYDGLKQREP